MKRPVQILLEDVERALLRHAPREQVLIGNVRSVLAAMKDRDQKNLDVFKDWKPTPENIKALPSRIREHAEECDRLIKENEGLLEMLGTRIRELDEVLKIRGAIRDADIQQRIAELQEMVK